MKRAELVKTLELVRPALAATNMIPIFQCFTFNNGKVSAYNDSIAIVGPSEIEQPCGIHGNTLLGLVSNSSAEEFELSLDRSTATIKLGKTVSKLPFDPPENFIFNEPEDEWSSSLTFTVGVFEALKLCLETTSNDATQDALRGITIQGSRLYSCDGDTLTRTELNKGLGKKRYLMSTEFCSAIIKLWSTMDMVKGVLSFNDEWAKFGTDEWAIFGRILEIKEPIDFEALIKKSESSPVKPIAVPEGLSEALSRARVLADPESQKTTITITKNKMVLVTDTHMGEIRDELPFKGHPDIVVDVNAQHLQKAIKTCDEVAFHENSAVLVKAPDVLMVVSNM